MGRRVAGGLAAGPRARLSELMARSCEASPTVSDLLQWHALAQTYAFEQYEYRFFLGNMYDFFVCGFLLDGHENADAS